MILILQLVGDADCEVLAEQEFVLEHDMIATFDECKYHPFPCNGDFCIGKFKSVEIPGDGKITVRFYAWY